MDEIHRVTEAFTELAPSYINTMNKELTQFWGISYPKFVERLVSVAGVKEGEKVLDIATGTAVIPQKLNATRYSGERIVGVDITPAMLKQGRKAINQNGIHSAIDLVCASAMDMPFADGTFEVIICGLGTHHMNIPKMLQEAKRLLVRSGRIIICDVGATPFWRSRPGKILLRLLMWLYGFANRSARSQAEIEAFHNVRTAQEWLSLLKEFGFGKVHIDEIRPRFPWFPSGLTMQAEIAG
ncbi:MAG: class I SAM-dependent methyltransferase [Anaerolineales bacterium]